METSRLRQLGIGGCAALASLLSGCTAIRIQSALDPAGPQSYRIDRLWWLFFWVCTAIFVIVMAMLAHSVRRGSRRAEADESPQTEGRITKMIIVGAAISVVILFVFMVADFTTGRALTTYPAAAQKIRVTGYQWWWDFNYENDVASQQVRTSDEIHIPTGVPVQFVMTAADVIHSLWVPNLHGKTDLIPGYQTGTWFQADRPGTYRGQCAEYCGHQHAHMAFMVVAEPPDQFSAWLENQRKPAPEPATPEQQRGQQVFLTRTCVMCHQIRGTPAGGRTAPDLTHLATRQTLAAGTLANNRENLRGWVTDPQHYKPGTKMPANPLSDEELNTLLTYLESLK